MSWGKETARKYTQEQLEEILSALDTHEFGTILRAKGMVAGEGDQWLFFDYVPKERNVRAGSAQVIGRLCVIGSDLKEEKLMQLFGLEDE